MRLLRRPGADLLSVALAVAAAASWGVGVVVAKAGLDRGVPPLTFATVQLAASALVLLILTGPARLTGAMTKSSVGTGVLEYGIGATLVVAGVSLTSAGNAAVINAAEPVLMVIAAALIIGERVRRTFAIPLLALVAGLLATTAPDLAATGTPSVGDLLILISAVSGAVYAVLSRRLVSDIAPLPLAAAQQAFGLLAIGLCFIGATAGGLVSGGINVLAGDPVAFALTIVSGLLQHSLAVWLHLVALQRMPASLFAIYLGLVPAFALTAAYLLLGQPATSAQLAGGILVVSAAIVSTRTTVREKNFDSLRDS